MAAKKGSHNWSLRKSVYPLDHPGDEVSSPLREIPSGLQKKPRVSISQEPPKKFKDKRHIFQRLEDNRHPNSLKRFQYHEQNYEASKRLVTRKINRLEDETLMDNINLYRLRQENILILEKSKTDEDRYCGDNQWEISLRENWTIEAEYNHLWSVPMPYDLLSQRTIERVGNPLKENMALDFFKKTDNRQDTRKSRWGPFENYMERLEKGIRTTVPHRPNFLGFQLLGNKLSLEAPSPQRQPKGEDVKFGRKVIEATPFNEPAAKVDTRSVFFSAKAGEIANHVVTMKNIGATAFFYVWKKRPEDPLVKPAKSWHANQVPAEQRFTVLETSGRLVPGESRQFKFSFMSKFAGSFFETWVLWTAPVLPDPPFPIFLKGIATFEDPKGCLRNSITVELQRREMVSGVQEDIEELLDTSSDLTCRTLKKKPDYLYTAAAYNFLVKNLGSEPPLYYNPYVDEEFRNLVDAVNLILVQEAEARKPKPPELPPEPPPPPKKGAPPPPPPPPPEPEPIVTIEWDGSASNVLKTIQSLETEENRNEFLRIFPRIIDSAAIPAHPSSAFHVAIYKLFKEAIFPLHDAIDDVLAGIAARAKAEAEARLEARRKKAEEDGLDPDMVEEEPPPAPVEIEPQIGEDGEEIPPPPPPKLYENPLVYSAVVEVLKQCFLGVEDEIEKFEDAAISVIDTRVEAQKGVGRDQQTLWNIFALEREKLFIVLGKDRDLFSEYGLTKS